MEHPPSSGDDARVTTGDRPDMRGSETRRAGPPQGTDPSGAGSVSKRALGAVATSTASSASASTSRCRAAPTTSRERADIARQRRVSGSSTPNRSHNARRCCRAWRSPSAPLPALDAVPASPRAPLPSPRRRQLAGPQQPRQPRHLSVPVRSPRPSSATATTIVAWCTSRPTYFFPTCLLSSPRPTPLVWSSAPGHVRAEPTGSRAASRSCHAVYLHRVALRRT